MVSRCSRRSTIMSTAPCFSRNSLRWNPSGSVSPIVCSMTRGPVKADERVGFGDVHVPQHSETRPRPPRSWDRSAPTRREVVFPRAARAPHWSWPSGTARTVLPASEHRHCRRTPRGNALPDSPSRQRERNALPRRTPSTLPGIRTRRRPRRSRCPAPAPITATRASFSPVTF